MATVVFDLDGTLVDTALDLVDALNATLRREGLPVVPYDEACPRAAKLCLRGLHQQA